MEDYEERFHELYGRTDPDETLNLMLITIDKIQFEYQEARRKEYAKLFINSILLGDKIDFDKKRMFFQLFGELSDADIELLSKFYINSHVIQNGVHLEVFRPNLIDIVPLIMRLESRGLIYQRLDDYAIKMEMFEGSRTNFDSTWRNKFYGLTPMGVSFCEFISSSLS